MTPWRTTTIENLASGHKSALATGPFGSAVASKNFRSSGVPMLRGSNLSDDVGTKLDERDLVFLDSDLAATFGRSTARRGDLVFTCWGSVGQIGLIDDHAEYDEYVVSNKQMKLSPDKEQVDPLFLYYNMSQPKMIFEVQSRAIGSTIPGFNLGQLRALKVEIPELAEQRGIAAVLGALDNKIAANSRLITKVGEVLETTFALLCGQPDEMVPFSEIATITKGVSYRSADLCDSSTALVTLKSFDRNGGYSLRGLKEYAGPFKPAQQIAPGELVVAQTDLTQAAEVVGRAVRVPGATRYEKLVASLDLAIVRPRQDSPVEFLLGVMLQGRFRAHCRSRTSGTTVLHLASEAIPSFQAPLVSREIQENYASLTRPMLQLRDSLEYEMDSLAATRDALLPQLMSGKLRVKDAEKVLEDAGV
jgi:type I restriction enzyme S subunit